MSSPPLQVYTNRTLNMRSVEAIGYDMDYTLIHYYVEEWEREAFEHARAVLAERDLPVEQLRFDPAEYIQGLILDLELGNVLKATRFGYIIQARHGTRPLSYAELREVYAGTVIDLHNSRFLFLNTMFSLSAASLYAQLVDLLDSGRLAEVMGYDDLWRLVSRALDETHTTGSLKEMIVSDPDRFCAPDPETAMALRDQKLAGKKLLLITNSDWAYARPMMEYAIGQFLEDGDWRSLFDVIVVAAAKPTFFTGSNEPFEIVDPDRGLMVPHQGAFKPGALYYGGSARRVEQSLGLTGDQFLYVGDHLFGDVHASKATLHWRTALVVRELEDELEALVDAEGVQERLGALMTQKDVLQDEIAQQRMERETARSNGTSTRQITSRIEATRRKLLALDERIAPLARNMADRGNPTWGLMMRAGSDKSMFARQVERHADLYMSRVSNMRARTPFAYFRAARAPLPHEDHSPMSPDPSV